MFGNRPAILSLIASLAASVVSCTAEPPARDNSKSAQDSAAASGPDDRLLLAAARVALPPPGFTPADLPEPRSPGAQALSQFCVRCHNLPTPGIHASTDWPGVARRMWLRMDHLAPELGVPVPNTAQRATMLNYLIDNALKVSGATLPAGAGRQEFSQVCSQCHSLPDPRQHSSDDWPAVIIRMGSRMRQMQVTEPPQGDMQAIVNYLQRVTSTRGARPQ